MDTQLEFTAQAFSKMVMHAMKYPHSVCSGLLLSPRPTDESATNAKAERNEDQVNNQARGAGADADEDEEENNSASGDHAGDQAPKMKIIDAIPISHASHYLAPNIEVALNSVSVFAQAQELVISGYYQTDKFNETGCVDVFGQKVTEKIAESYPNAVLCFVSFEGPMAQTVLELHHLIDNKWHRKPPNSYQVEEDTDVIAECILYSKEKLYRKIVDFDDHFNNISLDWTNAQISQRIDYLVANIC